MIAVDKLDSGCGVMHSSGVCSNCGKPSKVNIGDGKGGTIDQLCHDCFNRQMASQMGIDMPDNVPEQLSVAGKRGKIYDFDVEFMIFASGKSLTATERVATIRKADVWGSLDDDFDDMLDTLKKRIKKALSVKYMGTDGRIKDRKAVGYIEYDSTRDDHVVVIDGKPYTWEELGQSISTFEGWKIKIEFGSVGDELD